MELKLPVVEETVPWYRRSRRVNNLIAVLFCAGVLWGAVQCLAWGRAWTTQHADSRSVGTSSSGSLEGGRSISPVGEAYQTYSIIGAAAGRQYVHGKLADTLIAAMAARGKVEEGRSFVIGETGWRRGGPFSPHKTHQNGLSVDIFMPVRENGKISEMPTYPWQKFGYDNEFDDNGQMGSYSIDFESVASLILEIQKQAAERSLRIERIIIAPEYVPKLLGTRAGKGFGRLEKAIMKKPAWVRHDEHVHLDFLLAT